MSNQKLQILPLNNSQKLQPLTEQEMLMKGQGNIDIEIDGSADFENATIGAYDLPPGFFEQMLEIARLKQQL